MDQKFEKGKPVLQKSPFIQKQVIVRINVSYDRRRFKPQRKKDHFSAIDMIENTK